MKRVAVFLLFIACTQTLQAQSLTAQERTVAGSSRSGLTLFIDADVESVKSEWEAFWKEIGKMKRQRTYYTISELKWSGLSAPEAEGYSELAEAGTGRTEVWLAVEAAAMGPGLDKTMLASQILEDFEFRYYRNELKSLIAEAEQAESYLSKSAYRNQKEMERLEKALVRNSRKKERLEEKLEATAQEKINLEESLQEEQALRVQAQKDLAVIQERLAYLRQKLANFVGNQDSGS